VTEAAARLQHMSQPALSHQIVALERELGTPVVNDCARGAPTAEGRAVVADARAAVAAAERVVATGRAVATVAGGQLRIGLRGVHDAGLLAHGAAGLAPPATRRAVALTEVTSADALAELVSSAGPISASGPRRRGGPNRSAWWAGKRFVVAMATPRRGHRGGGGAATGR